MDAIARRLGHGAEIGDQRALAVGAGDMDNGRQLQVRRTEVRQQAFGALQPEIDQSRVKPHDALQKRIDHERFDGFEVSGPRLRGRGLPR